MKGKNTYDGAEEKRIVLIAGAALVASAVSNCSVNTIWIFSATIIKRIYHQLTILLN